MSMFLQSSDLKNWSLDRLEPALTTTNEKYEKNLSSKLAIVCIYEIGWETNYSYKNSMTQTQQLPEIYILKQARSCKKEKKETKWYTVTANMVHEMIGCRANGAFLRQKSLYHNLI